VRLAFAVLTLVTVLRLCYGAYLPLANDECYYWQWSRHLDLSYYDQGPGIALLIRFGTELLGPSFLGVRLGTILAAFGTGLATFAVGRRWFGERTAWWALALTSVAPLYAAGSILATYDGPQVLFWALGLYGVTRAVQDDRPHWWLAVGLCLAAGILCKLTMVLFAPCVLALLLIVPAYRAHLRSPWLYGGLVLGALGLVPILLWNSQHHWMGLLHTLALGSRGRGAPPWRWLGDFLAGQLLFVGPVVWLVELAAILRLLRRRRTTGDAFLAAFTVPVLLVCIVTGLRSKMEVNWPAPLHLAGLLAVAVVFEARWHTGRLRLGIAASLAASGFLGIVAFFPGLLAVSPWSISAQTGEKLNEPYGWPILVEAVQDARAEAGRDGRPVFVSGVNYRSNSILAYYLPDRPQTQALFLGTRHDQYFVWTRPERLIGQNVVLCLDGFEQGEQIARAQALFDSLTPYRRVEIHRSGYRGAIKRWQLFIGRNFHGYDPESQVVGF
jgi:undecaprenyl-diphosphatase